MKVVYTLVFYLQHEASGTPYEASEYETFEVFIFHLAKALCNTVCYSVGWMRFYCYAIKNLIQPTHSIKKCKLRNERCHSTITTKIRAKAYILFRREIKYKKRGNRYCLCEWGDIA